MENIVILMYNMVISYEKNRFLLYFCTKYIAEY